MFGKICPYCKERIKKDAIICRYCHKELEPTQNDDCGSSMWMVAGLMGILVGAAAALGLGFVNEKRRWEADTEEVEFREEQDSCD